MPKPNVAICHLANLSFVNGRERGHGAGRARQLLLDLIPLRDVVRNLVGSELKQAVQTPDNEPCDSQREVRLCEQQQLELG